MKIFVSTLLPFILLPSIVQAANIQAEAYGYYDTGSGKSGPLWILALAAFFGWLALRLSKDFSNNNNSFFNRLICIGFAVFAGIMSCTLLYEVFGK